MTDYERNYWENQKDSILKTSAILSGMLCTVKGVSFCKAMYERCNLILIVLFTNGNKKKYNLTEDLHHFYYNTSCLQMLYSKAKEEIEKYSKEKGLEYNDDDYTGPYEYGTMM